MTELQIIGKSTPIQPDDLSDDELMLLIKGDHRAAFATLLRRYQTLVLTYADRYVGNRELARDVAQEAFVTLWQTRAGYRPEGRFKSYLLAVTHNRCRERARRERGQRARADAIQHDGGTESAASSATRSGQTQPPLEQLLEQERAAQVRARLGELEPKMRDALLLRFAGDLSYEEIAEVTGRRVGTLKSHVCRGLQRLRTLLAEEYRA